MVGRSVEALTYRQENDGERSVLGVGGSNYPSFMKLYRTDRSDEVLVLNAQRDLQISYFSRDIRSPYLAYFRPSLSIGVRQVIDAKSSFRQTSKSKNFRPRGPLRACKTWKIRSSAALPRNINII